MLVHLKIMFGGKTQKENVHCSCQEENHQQTDSAHSDSGAVTVTTKKSASDIPVLVRRKVFMTCKVNLALPSPAWPL